MSDGRIRAVIGQKTGQASKFDVMNDQRGHNHYYSSSNREYTVALGYTEKWHWTRWSVGVAPLFLHARMSP